MLPAWILREWREYARLEPFGARRDNWHTAMLAAILVNAHRDPKKPPVSMSEFFYRDEQTEEEEKGAKLVAFLSGFKPKDK